METYMVVGLGNPGPRYAATPHNCGYMAVDALAERIGGARWETRFNAKVAAVSLSPGAGADEARRLILLKPETFMNDSGESVARAVGWYKASPERTVVVYDDVDLPPRSIRVRERGGPGTHNGMRSVVKALGTDGFPRVRIGIGRPGPGWDIKDYVLRRLGECELGEYAQAFGDAAEAVLCVVRKGAAAAMNEWNGRGAGDGRAGREGDREEGRTEGRKNGREG